MEKHSTGAATLLIHILAKAATNIFVTRTVRGFVPALLSTNVAILFAISYLDNAAAIVKPPRRSMIVGVHIAAKIYLVASFVLSRRCNLSSERTTLSTTQRNGTSSDVTNSGITLKGQRSGQKLFILLTSVAHNMLTNISMAKQFCCSTFCMIFT